MWKKVFVLLFIGIFTLSCADEIDVESLKNSFLKKAEEIKKKYEYIEKLPREERIKEIEEKQKEIREYLQSLGLEKLYLLIIELDKEAPGESGIEWLFYYYYLNRKGSITNDPKDVLYNYLYSYKYQDRMSPRLKEYLQSGYNAYFQQSMTFQQEKNNMNEGLKFLSDPKKFKQEKKIIIQFLWDVWSGFLWNIDNKVKEEDKKGIYEEMSNQVIKIGEELNKYLKDPELLEETKKILNNFYTFYTKPELPDEFKETKSYSVAVEILKSMLVRNKGQSAKIGLDK